MLHRAHVFASNALRFALRLPNTRLLIEMPQGHGGRCLAALIGGDGQVQGGRGPIAQLQLAPRAIGDQHAGHAIAVELLLRAAHDGREVTARHGRAEVRCIRGEVLHRHRIGSRIGRS